MQADSSIANATAGNLSTCSTPECAAVAKSILEYIDMNVDPCSDFYQYTCGGWLNNAVIPDDQISVGTQELTSQNMTQVMRSILEGNYSDVYHALYATDEGFHTEDEVSADKENFDLMQSYYNICLNESQIDSLGPTPIYPDIANLENKLFPVENENEMYSQNYTSYVTQAVAALLKQSIYTLNTFYVNPDDNNPDINTIFIDQASLGLPSKEYYQDPTTLTNYKNGLTDILTKVIGEYSNGTQDEALRVSESQKVNFTRWNNAKVSAAVDRFIAFESQLANISLQNDEVRDPSKMYHPTNLTDFQEQHSAIDWTAILKEVIPSGTETPAIINNRVPEYNARLNALLSNNTVSLQTLQEYFIIRYVSSKALTLDSVSRNAYSQMNGQVSSGLSVDKPRWNTCVKDTSDAISNVLGRYYVLKRFGGEKERKEAEDFLTTFHDAWEKHLPELDWLDNQTLANAIEKLNMITQKVAYSTVSPDVRSPSSLKQYYSGLQVNKTSYYDTDINYNLWLSKKTWSAAGQKVDKDEWIMPPQTLNAYYNPYGNEIVVPTGFLQAPFYDINYPDYLNYGGVGMIIAHEITHAFDTIGRQYDGHGRLTNWWTNETSATFTNKTQCFVEQYSAFNVTGPDNKTINVNGQLTLAENLADNGGLAVSLSALRGLNKTAQALPGLEHLSPEALYFINFGRSWCSEPRPEVALLLTLVDTHSPTFARVNGAVQNNPDFAKVFNCPAGSPMNPTNKCSVW